MSDVEFIVAPGQTYAVRELAETLVFELDRQDMPGAVTLGAFPGVADVGDLPPVYVIVDPHRFLAASAAELPEPALLRRTIVIWIDGPPADGDELVETLRWAGAVFATSQRAVAGLWRAGVRTRLLRAGYTLCHDDFDPGAERPIDALFLGVQTPRRTQRLAAAAEVLAGAALRIHASEEAPRADQPDAPLATPRWAELSRAEIVLGVHAGEDRAFDWPGALDAIHRGAVVVCEHGSAIAPLVAGEHLFVAAPDALPHVARALLRDRARLQEVRAAAYARVRDWVPYALWASVLRAAVVELIGEPLTPRRFPVYI